MNFCPLCKKRQEGEGWYIGDDKVVTNESECQVHPVLSNWRVVRTLKTMRAWSLEPSGYAVQLSLTCRMPVNMGGGHINERTARAKIFDYEGPFIDLLVENGYLDRHPGTPTTLTVTAKGDEFIRQTLLEQEAKGGVGTTAHFKK